jgi:hypothetical protein
MTIIHLDVQEIPVYNVKEFPLWWKKYQQPDPKTHSKPKYTGFDLRMGRTIREPKSFTPHYEIESKI